MQGNWQHIIYDREETPPPGAWDNIAHKLEMADTAEYWTTELYLKEATPPLGLWNEIAAGLDAASGKNWHTKLYEKEVAPPAGVWAAISTALDTAGAKVITMPPAHSIKKINYRLAAAAAAAVIITIAGTALWFAGKQSTDSDLPFVAKNTATSNPANIAVKETAETAVLPATETQEKEQPAAIVKKQINRAPASGKADSKIIPPLEYVKNNQMGFLPDNPVLSNSKKLPDNNGQVNTDIALMETPANTYISISGPDGQSIRVSSKFANLIGYLSDGPVKEERLDVIIRESARWKATFMQWREKMISNTTAPSLGNFMDIIEMSKMLSEK